MSYTVKHLVGWMIASVVAAAGCDADEAPQLDPIPIEAGACGHGLVVVSSDYASTSVSIVGFDGRAIAADFFGSGSATPGLSAALSGDVVVPTGPSDRVVLIDRSAASLTWFEPSSAKLDQLSVGTGFASNPYDVLAISPDKAYVARYLRNVNPGREAFDAGSDLLVVGPPGSAIQRRVDLDAALAMEEPGLEPHPTRMLRRGDTALVLLGVLSADYEMSGQGRLVVLDTTTDAITRVIGFPDAKNCNGLAVSPSGRYVGVSCSGRFILETRMPTVAESFVLVLDAEADFVEVGRLAGADFDQSFTFSLGFASDEHLLVPTFGSKETPKSDDLLVDFAWRSGAATAVHRSAALTLGDVRCVCETCYVADASSDALLVFGPDEIGAPVARARTEPVTRLGLPPRAIGTF